MKTDAIQSRVRSAMLVSDCWWQSWLQNRDSNLASKRRLALYSKARAAVVHDRVLNYAANPQGRDARILMTGGSP